MTNLGRIKWWVPVGGLFACATVVTAGFAWTVSEATQRRSENALAEAGIIGVTVTNAYRDIEMTGPTSAMDASLAAVRTLPIVHNITYVVEPNAEPGEVAPTPSPQASVAPSPSTFMPAVEAVAPEAQTLTFVTGSSELSTDSTLALDALATVFLDALEVDPTLRLSIEAHTDATGSEAYNQALSAARAETVRDYLVGAGVPGGSLVAAGYGESRPVASNDSEAGRASNRRVEITILED